MRSPYERLAPRICTATAMGDCPDRGSSAFVCASASWPHSKNMHTKKNIDCTKRGTVGMSCIGESGTYSLRWFWKLSNVKDCDFVDRENSETVDEIVPGMPTL